MILEYDGVTVDYFERFPSDIKRIGISLSGGADSALILYLLARVIRDRDQDTLIYPIHGYDLGRKNVRTKSWQTAELVIDTVKEELPDWKNIIQKPHIFAYDKTISNNVTAKIHHSANLEYMKSRHNFNVVVSGMTQGMPHDSRPADVEDIDEEALIRLSKETLFAPFGAVNKRFIAHFYREFNLERLLSVTHTCNSDSPEPCENCWWCDEKHWAFGHY